MLKKLSPRAPLGPSVTLMVGMFNRPTGTVFHQSLPASKEIFSSIVIFLRRAGIEASKKDLSIWSFVIAAVIMGDKEVHGATTRLLIRGLRGRVQGKDHSRKGGGRPKYPVFFRPYNPTTAFAG